MAFMFRSKDLTSQLGAPLGAPGDESVCGMVRKYRPTIAKDLNTLWTDFRGDTPASTYQKVEKPFQDLGGWWGKGYGDGAIIKALYAANAEAAQKILGHEDASSFLARFHTARFNAFQIFTSGLATKTLIEKSFLLTYLHKDIEYVFIEHKKGDKHAIDPVKLQSRVAETARIMLRILWGNISVRWGLVYDTRTIVTTVLLAMMHNGLLRKEPYRRDTRYCYNQSSVAFTLLTFSYLIAEVHKARNLQYHEKDWYFFWKILGSSLGLFDDFLPNSHAEATALWRTFKGSSEVHGDTDDVDSALIIAYNDDRVAINAGDIWDWIPAIVRNIPGVRQTAIDVAPVVLSFVVKRMIGT